MAKKKNIQLNEEPTLEPIPVTGIVKVLRKSFYENTAIIIRQIYEEYFEYLFALNGELYSSYIIIKLPEGRKEFTEQEIQECSALIYNGAMTTIDTLLGKEMDAKTKEYAELFESKREAVEGKKDA